MISLNKFGVCKYFTLAKKVFILFSGISGTPMYFWNIFKALANSFLITILFTASSNLIKSSTTWMFDVLLNVGLELYAPSTKEGQKALKNIKKSKFDIAAKSLSKLKVKFISLPLSLLINFLNLLKLL